MQSQFKHIGITDHGTSNSNNYIQMRKKDPNNHQARRRKERDAKFRSRPATGHCHNTVVNVPDGRKDPATITEITASLFPVFQYEAITRRSENRHVRRIHKTLVTEMQGRLELDALKAENETCVLRHLQENKEEPPLRYVFHRQGSEITH